MILAEGLNLGLSKMAGASSSHDFFQLSRLSRWHVESDAIKLALAIVIETHARLPMARFWGEGLTASSDGQFFPSWWRCSETVANWRRIAAYGRSKRMQQAGHGWVSLNLFAACGRLHLNLTVPDA